MNLFTQTHTPQMTLRPYQQTAIEEVFKSFKGFERSLLVAPTGAGKTIMFADMARRVWKNGHRTLILAHREELLTQAVDKIFTATGLEAEIEKAEQHATADAPVVVASVQSLIGDARRMSWAPNHFGLVVVDEAHHVLATSYQKVLNHFAPVDSAAKYDTKVLGVTATPDRGDKRNLGQYFQTLAHEIHLLDLIKQGYLSTIKIKTVPIKIDLCSVKTVAGDYDSGDLDESISRYLDEIARAIAEHASFRKVLVFLPLIRTSKAFTEICCARGLAARHVDGASEDRDRILADFAANKFDVLCNAMLLTEGYDCPDVDCVVVLRPTKVRALYAQMVGRGTRTARGKDNLLLLDFIWLHERQDLIKPAHLIASSGKIAGKMNQLSETGDELDIEELQQRAIDKIEEELEAESEAKQQRENKLKEAIKENQGRKGGSVDALEFFTSLHDIENADYEPTMKWEYESPSEKQLQALANFGFNVASITCKGHASRILDRVFARRAQNLASPKQIFYLRKYGHPSPDTATFKEAKAFLDEKFKSSKVKFKAR